VGLAKAQALATHQRVRELGDGEEVGRGAARQPGSIHVRRAQNPCQQPQRAQRVAKHGERQRLQIVFAVIDIAEGSVVHAREDRLRLAQRTARQDACVLEGHGVPFLRHDAGTLHEGLRQAQEAELPRGPQQQILHQLAQIHHRHRYCRRRFGQVVNGRDGAVGVLRQPLEAQEPRRHVPVDGKGGSGDGARAQRAQIHACESRLDARRIARQEFGRRQ